MVKLLTDLGIARLKPDKRKRLHVFDAGARGLCVRITPKGTKTLTVVARGPDGKQVWSEIGRAESTKIADARMEAAARIKRIKAGLAPVEPQQTGPNTFGAVMENFLKREVTDKRRSAGETERILRRYVLPEWKDRPIASIRRGDVTDLLDKIEDGEVKAENGKVLGGPVMADRTLAAIRRLFNWHASRRDDFESPIVKDMARTSPIERARKRVLKDDEIRGIWPHLTGSFGAMLKIGLLTGARRGKLAAMKWADIDADGVWHMPFEDREKANAGELPLSQMALDIIGEQSKTGEYVFPSKTGGPLKGFSAAKRDLDKRVADALKAEGQPNISAWVVHDVRRTAKTLMQRAGVRPDISERVLGHVIAGVEGTYDRHTYLPEKADALKKLAVEVERVLNPPTANVVSLREAQ